MPAAVARQYAKRFQRGCFQLAAPFGKPARERLGIKILLRRTQTRQLIEGAVLPQALQSGQSHFVRLSIGRAQPYIDALLRPFILKIASRPKIVPTAVCIGLLISAPISASLI